MLSNTFLFILFLFYLMPLPSCAQREFTDEYNEKYYADHIMHYFDINEIVNFTNYLIFNNSETNYNKKLHSVLARVRSDEIYEIFAHDDKGYETTVKLLKDLPNISNNISIYDIGSTIILLFDQTFYRQELYDDQKMCDYLLHNIENNFTTVYNGSSETLLEIYNPDKWIQRINDLDELYSMEELRAHFEYFLQNKTLETLVKFFLIIVKV